MKESDECTFERPVRNTVAELLILVKTVLIPAAKKIPAISNPVNPVIGSR
jgi:hypothetical protein